MDDSGEKTSFGQIVAVMGAILIAVGIAWLVFKNWSSIPDILKVVILLIAVGISYTLGVFLRIYDHEKIGESLIILGGLLYILSIFLIAQIFDLSSTLQTNSMLLLLAWVGVLISAYVFGSSGNLVVSMGAFLFWVSFQHMALLNFGILDDLEIGLGPFLLVFLVVGILFYGLSLWHHSRDHKFAGVYRWWTGFYFLVFVYVLSFQAFLPLVWPNGLVIPGASFLFIIVFLALAFLFLFVGLVSALNQRKLELRSVLILAGGLVLMLVLILSAASISGKLGRCDVLYCNDFDTQNGCNAANLPDQICEWQQTERVLYQRDGNNELITDTYCETVNCRNFEDIAACASAPSKLNCRWDADSSWCREERLDDFSKYDRTTQPCGQYDNNRDSCLSEDYCRWRPSRGIGGGGDAPLSLWITWIFANIMLLLVILAVIGYGVWRHSPRLVNLGITFFVLGIITRYIGFIMDFWDYGGLSLLFIAGGIILIFGGWLIERWRRKLVKEAKQQEEKYQDYW
ncbi:hypothetical protein COY00_00905 [Candidatus Pacearchaeota archaeon CG_4_10_14_0_2_um_filter_35_33]|nr:MAG: hypothetical protein COY00_00905 [Candidatus Pacearchaeota archaeon CG_4_10_14_0_2_um_filter_35_33]